MKNSKVKAILMSGLMAASMMIMPMSAMAEGTITYPTVTVDKTLQMANGVDDPNVTFTYNLVQDTTATPTAPESVTIDNSALTISSTDLVANSLNKTVEATGLATAMKKQQTAGKYGVYTFTLTEAAPNPVPTGWTYSDASYKVRAYVSEKSIGYTIEGTDGKKDKAAFTNKYVKTDGKLTISKTVQNDYADKTQEYSFTIKFYNDKNGYNDANTKILVNNTEVGFGEEASFVLKAGESLEIKNIPVGVTYDLTESVQDLKNFTGGNFAVTEDGGTAATNTFTKDGPAKVEGKLVGDGTNTAVVTNTFETVTPTGVVTSIAPFIALIAIAAIAIAVYTSMKKRMTR